MSDEYKSLFRPLTPEEFEMNAVPARVFIETTKKLVEEEQNRLINPSQLRRNEELSGYIPW